MAVIREDVVSIGFEVENNPFSELTAGINDIKAKLGILDETASGLKDVSKEALTAGQNLDSLADSTHAPPILDETIEKTKETQKETKKTEVTFTSLAGAMVKTGRVKLDNGIKSLADGVKKPVTGFKDLAKSAKTLGSNIKTVGLPHALNTGLGKAAVSTGKLLMKLKDVAGLGFNKAVSGLKTLTSEAGKAAGALGKGALNATGKLAKGVGVGIAAAGTALAIGAVAAFNFGSAYETSLAKVSTMVDTSVMSVQELSSEVMSLSNKTGEGAAGLNEAVYQALSAGADTADVVGLVDVAVKAARGGFTDTTTAVDGLTSTLNAYGMQTKDAEGLANSFLITQNKGKTTFGELASSIGTVAPTASAAGVGVNELLAGVASLTANGIGTSEAMTGIKAAMSNIIKPSAEASKVAQSLGLDFSTAALQSKGLAGFLGEVKTATGGNMDTMAQLFGSVEALNTVLTLTSDNGMTLMQDTMNEMATNTTALDTAYETMSDTAQVSVQKGLNSFKNLGIGIYQSSEGIVSELTGLFSQSGSELYDAFTKGGFDGLVGQIGTTLSTVLTTVTGYLPDLVEGGVSIVNSLIDGITQNQEQIVGSLTTAIVSLQKGIIKILPKILVAGMGILTALVQGAAQNMPELVTIALEAVQTLSDGLLANVPLLVQSGISILNSLISGLLQSAPLIVSSGVTLITGLVQGLLNSVDLLINGAVNLVLALVTGLLSNIPQLVNAAVSLVTGLVNGIINNIDLIISGASSLIMGLLTGLLTNLPVIIQGGVQLIVALVGGLLQAIPLILGAMPRLIGAIIETVMNTDWLKLGLDIITGIGNGLINGIKGLFSKGKDVGREVGDGVTEGLTESTADITAAGETAAVTASASLQPDTVQLSDYGVQTVSAYGTGMESAGPQLTGTAGTLSQNTAAQFQGMNLSQTGYENALSLSQGLMDGSGQIVGTAQAISTQAADAAQTDVSVAVSADPDGMEQFASQTQAMVTDTGTTLGRLPDVFTQNFTAAAAIVSTEMTDMSCQMKAGFAGMLTGARTFASNLKSIFSAVNLRPAGVNIISGLNRGMLSMRPALLATASGLAKEVSGTINTSLDIHSPSRVTEESGENTALGMVRGMQNMSGKVEGTARQVGESASAGITPYQSRYRPESPSGSTTRNTSQVNNYSPQFNLTLNGASASDSNERKIKRWVREAWKENMESMGRKSPRLQEV